MAKLQPSMWTIFPTHDGHFQWAVTSYDAWVGSSEPFKTLAAEADDDPRSRLSSMKDLLLQAQQSNLLSRNKRCFPDQYVSDLNPGGVEGGTAMFSTGSGRTVSVRQSSIRKARTLLEGTNAADNGGCGDASKTLCAEADEDPRSRPSSMNNLLLQADQSNLSSSKRCFPDQHVSDPNPGGAEGGTAMFSTGSGRAVSVRQSSIWKAKSLLEGTNASDNASCVSECFPMFRTGLEKAVQVRESSMKKATSLLEGTKDERDQPMDQVDLLKPTQNDKGILMNAGVRIRKTIDGNRAATFQSIPHFDSRVFSLPGIPVCNKVLVDQSIHEEQDNRSTYPPLKFHTAGGRAISVSTDALKHARTLLDDLGSEGLDGEINANDKGILMNAGLRIGKTIDGNGVTTFQSNPHYDSRGFGLPGIPVCNKALVDHCIPEEQDSRSTYPPFKFHTAGGRSISVSTDALKHARTLLDDLGSEAFDGEVNGSDKGILMNAGLRIGRTIDDNGVATFQSNPHFDLREFGLSGIPVCNKALVDHSIHEEQDDISTYPPLKFHTTGGRSISISTDALKHATTLLDDLGSEAFSGEVNANVLTRSTCDNKKISNKASNNIKSVSFCSSQKERFLNRNVLEIPSSAKQLCHPLMKPISSIALPTLVESKHDRISSNNGSWSKPPNEDLPVEHITVPLVENHLNGEKQKPGKGWSSSSFKRPRISSSLRLAETEAALPSTSVNCCYRAKVSLRYPFQLQRKKLKEFFGGPPCQFSMLVNVPDGVRYMTADSAENYRFRDTCSNIDLGPEEFREMLLHSGASQGDTTEKWVANHYKWIVWKLACLERCYPSKMISRFLTVFNVLDELKYRYEREVNYGHKSALKKVLDGDISPSSMMILCVSAIRSGRRTDEMFSSSSLHEYGNKLIEFDLNYAVKVELTDGWYSMDATLDMHLSKQLIAGKLFVGQKLRVCGATLCGWDEPVSPLEAPMASFALHINGTYRAHWADSLGLCKGVGTPLAFRCIKGGGGRVPITLVGISRLYPILYKERLPDGSIVRSEILEKKVLQLYRQRRSDIAEDIISELDNAPLHVTDSGEGAKILRILEGSSEPEVLMAGMSSEQLISFSTYQAKQEALRQDNLHKKIEKAFEEAGLGSRDVTPFMKVKVMGLISVGSSKQGRPREGLITIWNPTEKQKLDLVEGQIYSVSCLTPLKASSDFLHLQTRGTSSEWNRLPSTDSMNFKPFFIPRKSVPLSDLGEVPLASEFDIAAVVVHVGKVYVSGCQKKQWIFVTDGSGGICSSSIEDRHDDCLLAISFRSPIFGNDSLEPVNRRLSGSTVGFCNLIKRARDQNNHLWVAEATETCTYSVFCNISQGSHLKEAADSALRWANSSSSVLQKLEERVLCITGGI